MDIIQTKNEDTTWIESLALDELNMEESGIVSFNEHLDPEIYLEGSSIKFVEALRGHFEVFVQKFNQYRGNGGEIKIFKISNTVNDFMLFRNSMKLLISRKSNDLIHIGFLSSTGGIFAARMNKSEQAANMAHEIRAHIGSFNDITWRYEGEEVSPQQLCRHYLTEFIKQSAR